MAFKMKPIIYKHVGGGWGGCEGNNPSYCEIEWCSLCVISTSTFQKALESLVVI